MSRYPTLIDRAMALAASAHRDQVRKDPTQSTPYIAHTAMVGLLLQRAGFEEHVVAAGILHDTVEDTELSIADLQADFGLRVAKLVSAVTEHDKSLPWETRKSQYLDHLTTASLGALAIAAADKLHNAHSLISTLDRLEAQGQPASVAWGRFKRGREASLGFLRRACDAIGARADEDPRLGDLCEALSEAVGELERR